MVTLKGSLPDDIPSSLVYCKEEKGYAKVYGYDIVEVESGG